MKNIFDYKGVKSVSAFILINKDTKEIEGKIIANWSDNPAGSICTAQIFFSNDKLVKKQKYYASHLLGIGGQAYDAPLIGKAGGYGYDKISSAISSAIHNNCTDYPRPDFAGVGMSGVEKYFDTHFNINVISVIG